ncbi:hypothetical protein [Aeromicrobium sp. Leaf350]|uniref:hypothetical protein n=1 Tax=Aeromicrobium sp. Leaf350 TaxID=2876565 RepID=UPI001E517AAC|nr:hypothetical protein [Aeromicrobium sp. Leaf350]
MLKTRLLECAAVFSIVVLTALVGFFVMPKGYGFWSGMGLSGAAVLAASVSVSWLRRRGGGPKS